jgi:hypothetical protein
VARSANGTVCAPSAEAIADAIRVLLEKPAVGRVESHAERGAQDAWLAEHGWDFAADQVARALGIDTEIVPYAR